MTKTFTTPTTTATTKRDADVIRLLEITLTSPSALTLRFSDAYRSEIGQEWLPMVVSWGTIDEAMNTVDVGGRPNGASVRLFNTKSIEGKDRLSSLMKTAGNTSGTYEFAFAKVTVYELLFSGATLGDEVKLGVFYLDDTPDINERTIEFTMSDVTLMIEDKMKIYQLTNNNFPLADPDDVGKDIPVVIGVLKNVPCLACVAGWRSSSSSALTATQTGWITVSDDRAPTGGVGQIDDEQFEWTAKATNSGVPQISISRRGINGTTAAPHAAGAGLFQVRSGVNAYGYLVSENQGNYKISSGSVTNVRVNGVLQTNVTIDYDNTTLVSGRSFVVIWFPALPTLKRQVALDVSDKIGVADTIAVSSPSTTTVKLGATSLGRVGIGNSSAARGGEGQTEVNFPDPGGTVDTVFYSGTVRIGFISANEFWLYVGNPAVLVEHVAGAGPTGDHWFQYGSNGPVRAVKARVVWASATTGANSSFMEIWATAEAGARVVVNRAGAASKTGTATLTGNSTADVVIGGQVTCDVTGVRDDGSGTMTGTASAIIRKPADVTRFLLLQMFPGPVAGDLGTTWTTTRTAHTNGGYTWDFLLTKHRFSDIRRKVGEQGRTALHLEGGKWELRWLTTSTSASAQVTLDYLTDFWDGMPVRVSRTPRADIRNSITVYAARDYRKSGALKDQYTTAMVRQNLTGFSDRLAYDLELDFIQSVTMATRIGAWWLSMWKRQRLIVEGVAFHIALKAEKFDLVAITNHPILDDMAPLGVYRVIEKRYLLDDDNPARIYFKAIEANV